jgi:hypothetical protein
MFTSCGTTNPITGPGSYSTGICTDPNLLTFLQNNESTGFTIGFNGSQTMVAATSTATFSNATFTPFGSVSSVPEPATVISLAIGLSLVAALRRRLH